jgi:hypothetical protein
MVMSDEAGISTIMLRMWPMPEIGQRLVILGTDGIYKYVGDRVAIYIGVRL